MKRDSNLVVDLSEKFEAKIDNLILDHAQFSEAQIKNQKKTARI